MAHLSDLGPHATLLDVYQRYPAVARHTLGLAEAAFTMTDEFSRAECELLGTYVSSLNNCEYCQNIHSAVAVACGLPASALADSGAATPNYGGATWQPVFRYVKTLTLSPATVDQQQVDALLAAGWSQDAVVQLVAVCGTFQVLNRMANGLGLTADASFFAAAGQRLASIGYGGTAQMLGIN